MAARSLTTSGFVVGGVASERRRLGQHRAVALITIAYLGRVGIHWFDGLPVISYAVSADPSRDTTASYSYRLSMNFGAGRLYESYLKNLRRAAASSSAMPTSR